MYSLDCSYYDKSFDTIQQLVDSVISSGMDPSYEGRTHWKPKGGHQFTMEVTTDVVMYTDDLEGKLTEIVKEQSNDLEKFEYRDHEVLFQEPTELSYDLLMKKIDNEEMAV